MFITFFINNQEEEQKINIPSKKKTVTFNTKNCVWP